VLSIPLPPLRDRNGDIRLLIEHFVGDQWKVSRDVLDLLQNYGWPGNIRQLLNAIDRAKILAEGDEITQENLPAEIVAASKQATACSEHHVGSKLDLDSLNKLHVEQVYRRNQCNKTKTAQALGIGRRSLYRLLDKYGIQ
jgi:transcriptional regulator with PAS, ATPase and Fis domain